MNKQHDSVTQEELEQQILAQMLSRQENIRSAVSTGIVFEHFIYCPDDAGKYNFYGAVYKTLVEFYSKFGSIITPDEFENELEKKDLEETVRVGINKAFSEVQSLPEPLMNFEYLLEELRERYIQHSCAKIPYKIKNAFAKHDPVEAYEKIKEEVNKIGMVGLTVGEPSKVMDVAGDAKSIEDFFIAEKQKREKQGKVTVGLPPIDEAVKGYRDSQLIVILGEVNKGKSTALLNWSCAAHEAGKNILFFSYEMPMWQCASRYMSRKIAMSMHDRSRALRIPYDNFKDFDLDPNQYEVFKDYLDYQNEQLDNYYIFVDQQDNKTVEEIEYRIRALRAAGRPPDAVFVDYLGIMELSDSFESRGKKDFEIVSRATIQLRNLARKYELPIFTAQQINREGLKILRKRQEKNDDDDHGSIVFTPEMIQDAKKTVDHADYVIGINPQKPSEHTKHMYMWYHQVKGRDCYFDPFPALFDPEVALIAPLAEKTARVQRYLGGNKPDKSATAMFNAISEAAEHREDEYEFDDVEDNL